MIKLDNVEPVENSDKLEPCPICGSDNPEISVSCEVVEEHMTYDKYYLKASAKCPVCDFIKMGAEGQYITSKLPDLSELESVKQCAAADTIEIWNKNAKSIIHTDKFYRIDFPCVFYNNRHCNLVEYGEDDWCAEGPCSKQMTAVEFMRMVARSAVKIGKWKFAGEGADGSCSVCRYTPPKGALLGDSCPNCGARMVN